MQSNQSSHVVPPFPAYPSASRYVALGSVEEAFNRVCRSVEAHEAISLVIGPPGTGKTLICNLLVDQFKSTHEVVVVGETEIENRTAFLRHLLHHLGADYSTTPENDLHLALVDRICKPSAAKEGMLIVVDEAQSLCPEVLEAIRKATNIMRSGQPRVSAVVCGAMKLDEVLIDRSLEAFTQRVATRCYLHPMNAHETKFYIHETIRDCGAEPDDTISEEAIAAIHHAASGVPRLVNQMMTQAIDCAAEVDEAMISETIVDRAWATLQQLPSPMLEQPQLKSCGGSTIEFGELELLPTKTSKQTPSVAQAKPAKCVQPKIAPEEDWDVDEPAPGRVEIEVTSNTAMWMDESDEPADLNLTGKSDHPSEPTMTSAEFSPPKLAPATPLPSVLFGAFEIEEEVVVGNSTKKPAPPTPPPVNELESMLHQEIIGLSTYDDSAFILPDEPSLDEMTTESHCGPQLMRVEAVCEPDELETSDRNEADDDSYDFDRDGSLRLAHDDSDLLVIEDEMDLVRTDKGSSTKEAMSRSVTIDFQSMLMKMRASS